jgi:hypothetical protein
LTRSAALIIAGIRGRQRRQTLGVELLFADTGREYRRQPRPKMCQQPVTHDHRERLEGVAAAGIDAAIAPAAGRSSDRSLGSEALLLAVATGDVD